MYISAKQLRISPDHLSKQKHCVQEVPQAQLTETVATSSPYSRSWSIAGTRTNKTSIVHSCVTVYTTDYPNTYKPVLHAFYYVYGCTYVVILTKDIEGVFKLRSIVVHITNSYEQVGIGSF